MRRFPSNFPAYGRGVVEGTRCNTCPPPAIPLPPDGQDIILLVYQREVVQIPMDLHEGGKVSSLTDGNARKINANNTTPR